MLDVGSSTGELLRRIVERWPGVTGLGIDLLKAPPIHPAVELRTGDAASIETERFDVVCCIDAIHALGGFPEGYRRLAALAPTVLLGDGYWRDEPDPAYVAALDATVDEMPMRDGLNAALEAAGLHERWSAEAEVADLTAYEEALLTNADRYPERPDVVEYSEAIRRWRAAPGGHRHARLRPPPARTRLTQRFRRTPSTGRGQFGQPVDGVPRFAGRRI